MGNFLDTVYDVIFSPKAAMRSIAERRMVWQAVFLFFISAMMPPWALKEAAESVFPVPLAGAALLLEFLGVIIFWFLASSVLGIIAETFGGRGSALNLFAALGFCSLPRIVVTPFWAVASFLPDNARAFVTGVIGTIVLVWAFYLSAEALAASYQISFSRAAAVMFIPFLIVIVIIILLAAFSGALLATWM